ncbi:GTP pyrophosphokinase [Anaerotignum sp.]
MLEKAAKLAEKAHQGQVDKGGQPYILHPGRVMEQCETETEKIVALLHDVMEDTPYTLEDLRQEGFSEEVLEALLCLTHRKGESYTAYIGRVCENPLAARVKYADLQDNMDLRRIPEPTERDFARLEKYKGAKLRIEKALGR